MKKIIVLLAVLFATITFSQRVKKGEAQINAGIGLTSGWGLPIHAGIDYGVHPDITVGGQITYASSSQDFNAFKVDATWFSIGANGNYHFNTLLEIPDPWDVYAGLTLAYNSFSYDYPQDFNQNFFNGSISGIGFALQLGGRYYFSEKFGVNFEFGGGNSPSGAKLGISYKL